jgi:glycosyltransferase involved in cell wall biosynthesis
MLSVVVIGRNEAENLHRLAASLQALREAVDYPVETIFVDSASTDDSVAYANQLFDRVYELVDSDQLCASAARSIGTIESHYPWILYLDGDMELCREFFAVCQQLGDTEEQCVGYIGNYIHRFDNGMVATQGFATGNQAIMVDPSASGMLRSEWAAHIGGAVLLRRSNVLAAGNWNPAVYGREEMNLYARLGLGSRVVRYVYTPMVYHYFEYHTRMVLLRRLLYPSGGQGKVYYGYGQSIRALFVSGRLMALIRLDYEPYLFWLLLLVALVVAVYLPAFWGLLLVVMSLTCLVAWMGSGTVVRYLVMPVALVLGWPQYRPDFRPLLKKWAGNND